MILSSVDLEIKNTPQLKNQHSYTESVNETENLNESIVESKNDELEMIIASNSKLNALSSQLLANVSLLIRARRLVLF